MNVLEQLRPLLVDIDTLVLDPNNARHHSSRNLESIKASLESVGQHRPAVVQKDGMVVRVGNGMVQAARELGWTQIAAVIVDEDDVTATARAIADNRIGELASWNWDILSETLKGLEEAADFSALGFLEVELQDLINGGAATTPTSPAPTPSVSGGSDIADETVRQDEINPDEIEDYDPDRERYLLKLEGVREADRDPLVELINTAMREAGYEYEIRAY